MLLKKQLPHVAERAALLLFRDGKGGLNLKEIWNLTEGNRNLLDPTGWVAEKLEWFVTYYLFADDDVSPPHALSL